MKKLIRVFLALLIIVSATKLNASEYVTFAKEGKLYHLIDESGAELSKQPMTKVTGFYNGYASCVINKKWHYIDQKGNAFTVDGPVSKVHAFSDGLGSYYSNKQWGFMNDKGEVVIEPAYQAVKIFKDGKCWVKQEDKWFQIDKTGKEIFTERFDKFKEFVDGVAIVKNDDFWGFINADGDSIAGGIIYDDVKPFYNDKAWVKKGDFWGVIDKSGNYLIEAKYTDAWYFFKHGYAYVELDDKIGAINADGTEFIPLNYEKILAFEEGFCGALKEDIWTVYDRTGKVIADGLSYFSKFQEGYAVIQQNDAYGILTKSGEKKILAKYQTIKPFVNGFAQVEQQDKWGYIDINLNEVVKPQFLSVQNYYSDWTIVKTEIGLWGFIDKQGSIKLQSVYEGAHQFVRNLQIDKEFGCERKNYSSSMFSKMKVWFVKADMVPVAITRVKLNGTWAYINKQGELLHWNFDKAENWVNGYARIKGDNGWGIIDVNGKIIIEPKYSGITEMFRVCN